VIPSNLGISRQQAPKTCGSPCCRTNIMDQQKLMSGHVYRGCAHCGRALKEERQ